MLLVFLCFLDPTSPPRPLKVCIMATYQRFTSFFKDTYCFHHRYSFLRGGTLWFMLLAYWCLCHILSLPLGPRTLHYGGLPSLRIVFVGQILFCWDVIFLSLRRTWYAVFWCWCIRFLPRSFGPSNPVLWRLTITQYCFPWTYIVLWTDILFWGGRYVVLLACLCSCFLRLLAPLLGTAAAQRLRFLVIDNSCSVGLNT